MLILESIIYLEGLKSLNWLSVKDRLFLHDSVIVRKCLHNLVLAYLCKKFSKRSTIHNRNTRYTSDLNLPKCRLAAGQRTFAFRGAKLYNNLPKDIKQVNNIKTFKKRITNYIRQ